MENKKIIWGGFLAVAFLAALMLNSSGYADDAGNPPSGQPPGNIGAWYDETWQATGFYRLQPGNPPDTFYYQYTSDPITASVDSCTFEEGPTDNVPTGGGSGKYTAAGASIPQDVVITEWSVTGHVHFKSGI